MSATKEHYHNEIEAGMKYGISKIIEGNVADTAKFPQEKTTKERPILFSTPMIKAILEGRKTQTRRVIHPQPDAFVSSIPYRKTNKKPSKNGSVWVEDDGTKYEPIKCPYGVYPHEYGHLLWVRETFAPPVESQINTAFYYKADFSIGVSEHKKIKGMWKPSIHMPKAAARLWLEVEEIKVERVQDISEEDAKAEGVEYDGEGHEWICYDNSTCCFETTKESFRSLWISINGRESWDANPWVWVIKYKELSRTGKPSFDSAQDDKTINN